MDTNNYVERAAEVLFRAANKKKKELKTNVKNESAKFASQINQVKNSEAISKMFDENAREILKRLGKK